MNIPRTFFLLARRAVALLVLGSGVLVGIPIAVNLANLFAATGYAYPLWLPTLLPRFITGTPVPAGTGVWVGVFLLLTLLGVAAVFVGWRGRDGLASGRALNRYVRRKSHPGRAPLTARHSQPLGRIGRFWRVWFRDMYEEIRIMFAPSGSGKTVRFVVREILRAVGPVVTTSTKPDVLRLTAGIRMKLFPNSRVVVFDPEGLTYWPWKVRWDIVAGCEDPQEAIRRATAIVAARPLQGDSSSSNSGFFHKAVIIVLQCMLHAAAVEGLTMREVMTWMSDFSDDTPYTILTDNPKARRSWERLLMKYCRGKADETVSSTDMSASGILNAFAVESILEAVCPSDDPDEMLNSDTFHATTDTLYLICKGEDSPASTVFTALVESMLNAASIAATRSERGFLFPPLSPILDEADNVCPIPSLKRFVSTGRGEGIFLTTIYQDFPQLVARYGEPSARTVINNATELLILGGLKDIAFLRDMSELAGDRRIRHADASGGQWERRIRPDDLHELRDGDALLFYRSRRAARIHLPAYWETEDADLYEYGKRRVRDLERAGREAAGATDETEDMAA
ncbi:type IV secretory system conjugative DNA transfer family protein [Leifsonia sp. NPDC102414]|uniref:type IV secretory system conjugative DNA transfer family protein n=1 Tax=Leifsonia sp. NPDC102414 TaxID=3364124 RepID=UPI0037F5B846